MPSGINRNLHEALQLWLPQSGAVESPVGARDAAQCRGDVLLRWLWTDHKTIADVRKDNGTAIRKVCGQFVELCRRVGLLATASVAIDGLKFKTVNNQHRHFTKTKIERRKKQIEEGISHHLNQLESADRQEPSEAITSTVTWLEEKVGKLKEETVRLKALETQMLAAADKQISLTDPDTRSMGERGPSLQAV